MQIETPCLINAASFKPEIKRERNTGMVERAAFKRYLRKGN